MTVASTADQVAAQGAVRSFVTSKGAAKMARDESGEAWRDLWPGLADLSLFSVVQDQSDGGAGGTLGDLAAMLEQAGADLVPGPVVSSAIGAMLCTDNDVPADVRRRIVSGALPVALAGPRATALPSRIRDGVTYLSQAVTGVDGAAEGVALILPAWVERRRSWALVLPDSPGLTVTPLPGIDFAVPLGKVCCDRTPVAALVSHPLGSVDDLYLTGVTAFAAGLARRCVEIAAEYANLREQFGRPIGSFQAIKHLCADMLCRAEQAAAVAWDASNADAADRPLAAAVAGAVALDAAVDNAKDCIQVLGGIGFTWEHDAHLYLRRALSLRHLAGGSARWRRRTAELTAEGARRRLRVDLGDVEVERPRVRQELRSIAALPCAAQRFALADSGYLAPDWPTPYGRTASTALQVLVNEELQATGLERPDLAIGWWALPTIIEGGSHAQLERFAAPTLRGELVWCQLFSEPGAGSDLASLSTTATRVEGGWNLTGQKVWNSMATFADWAICLARTDKAAPRHRGITYFLVDMSSPGIDVRPLREITGDSLFNEVFLDEVFVPDDCVVGQVNDGWRLARTTLANERVEMSAGGALGARTEHLLTLAAESTDPVVTDRIGYLVGQAMSNTLLAHRGLLDRMAGQQPGAESSLQKIIGVRQRQAAAELALELAGIDGICDGPESREFLTTRALSIAGGSTQILLSLVGERLLGLPRD